jgi:isopenicillin N synthase-like dioxygenase
LVKELYGEIRIFALPLETKHSYEIPGIGGQGGFLLEQEHAKGRRDLKEFWHFGQYVGKIQNMLQNILKMLK